MGVVLLEGKELTDEQLKILDDVVEGRISKNRAREMLAVSWTTLNKLIEEYKKFKENKENLRVEVKELKEEVSRYPDEEKLEKLESLLYELKQKIDYLERQNLEDETEYEKLKKDILKIKALINEFKQTGLIRDIKEEIRLKSTDNVWKFLHDKGDVILDKIDKRFERIEGMMMKVLEIVEKAFIGDIHYFQERARSSMMTPEQRDMAIEQDIKMIEQQINNKLASIKQKEEKKEEKQETTLPYEPKLEIHGPEEAKSKRSRKK